MGFSWLKRHFNWLLVGGFQGVGEAIFEGLDHAPGLAAGQSSHTYVGFARGVADDAGQITGVAFIVRQPLTELIPKLLDPVIMPAIDPSMLAQAITPVTLVANVAAMSDRVRYLAAIYALEENRFQGGHYLVESGLSEIPIGGRTHAGVRMQNIAIGGVSQAGGARVFMDDYLLGSV